MSEELNQASLPIYKKSQLLYHLVESLGASLPEENPLIQRSKKSMRSNVMVLSTKIVGAELGGLYSIKMQYAALIREYVLKLKSQLDTLTLMHGYPDNEYIALIRAEIEEFRKLFIDWVASFDKSNYSWDDWELFNPPGAVRGID
jgi:hypothetical protein